MFSKNRGKLCNLFLFFGVLYWLFGTEACYAEDKPDDIKKLLKERRDLLSKAVDEMTTLYNVRQSFPLLELIQADRDSFKADLDWFDKPEDRIKAIEKHKNAADSYLRKAKLNFAAGRDLESVVFRAKAYVLEVQVELLKEKEKQKAKPGK